MRLRKNVKPTRSLKARALQLLSQREQSQVELRRKLLAHLKAVEAKVRDEAKVPDEAKNRDGSPAGSSRQAAESALPVDPKAQVEAVLDWLSSHRFASDDRFAESRIQARSARFGNLRIRQELKQHAVVLTLEAKQRLDETEEARAGSVYRRRFETPPETAAERARRARFLAARGFSPEVIRRVLRHGGAPDNDAGTAG